MVRLVDTFLDTNPSTSASFNSTMVRLVARKDFMNLLEVMSFQFHYGTIGRAFCLLYFEWSCEFQFHYGTIGRYAKILVQAFVSGFNSTMVRLVEAIGQLLSVTTSFQFHYGTIGRGKNDIIRLWIVLFQFHYGTIGSRSTT